MSLYNVMGQFGGMYNNAMMNNYNDAFRDYQYQRNYAQNQYDQDLDRWNQMSAYDQQRQSYDMWHSGASRGAPLQPRERPRMPYIGPAPSRPGKVDFSMFSGMFGGGGGGGWSPTPPPSTGGNFNYGAYSGPSYSAPAAWNNRGIDTANMIDPSAVIASAQPGIMENMNKAFADAGNRFGSSGMVGTPYADALGTAARGASNDIANITNQYQFAAAQQAAELEQARQMAEYQADYNSWAQAGDWAHQGQLANMNQALSAWGQMGDWQYGAGQNSANLANQQWMAQNNWGQQNYQQQQQQQQQFLQNILPMLMGGMG